MVTPMPWPQGGMTPTPSAEAPHARRFGMIESFPLHRLRCSGLLSQVVASPAFVRLRVLRGSLPLHPSSFRLHPFIQTPTRTTRTARSAKRSPFIATVQRN